ncbi:MAG: HAMP domain-containing protein [Candidatus Omnitrophica bacterium]|nr:HAMP domain-containing protein [Candidatus Omnitrophota bacterium]
MKAISLKTRIILIVTIFTIVTISMFLVIQLAHEVGTVDGSIKYKAKTTSLHIEEKLTEVLNSSGAETKLEALGKGLQLLSETLASSIADSEKIKAVNKGLRLLNRQLSIDLPIEERIGYLGKGLEFLKNAESLQAAYILDRKGQIVFSTEKWFSGAQGDYDDLDIIKKLRRNETVSGQSVVNKSLKQFSVYIPLTDSQKRIPLVVRAFFPLGDVWLAIKKVYQPAIIVGVLLVITNIFLGIFLSRLVVRPIRVFNRAAKTIASGQLDSRVRISTNDELEELADTFNTMTKELALMKEKAEDANPLTKLPGNIVIMEDVTRRIEEGKKFTVIYCDLDNFKAFNDKYGIHKGDEAIMLTGGIFKEAVKTKGAATDFIGHEGGDDFLLVTEPERAQDLADHITSTFDEKVRALYNQEDLERGHIVAHARDGSVKQFPIMTISLAGITNAHRSIESYAEVTNIAAEVKKKAKNEPRSCFVLDKRKGDRPAEA